MTGPRRLTAPGALALALAGCAVGPDYAAPDPARLAVAGDYAAPRPASGEADPAAWWTRFDDPALTRLVEEAAAGNLDVAVAASRLAQAREALVQARSGRLPTLTAGASAGRSGFVTGAPSTTLPVFTPGGPAGTQTITAGGQNQLSLSGDAGYTVDLFGEIGRGIEAARADLAASALDADAVRVSVAGETASNYIQGRLAQERLAIARDSLANADNNFEIAGWRVKAGLVSAVDEEQARTQRAQRRSAIPPLIASVAQASNRLGVLTGRAPAELAAVFEPARPIPEPPDAIAVGVPADTLRQRPDVVSAERRLAAASARIGVARAQLYPALRITGNLGSVATGFGGFLDQITYGLFGGLSQTLFDGGRLRAQVRAQEAATRGAFADYRRTVLVALEDVENALRALRSAADRMAAQREAVDAATATAIYARSNYQAGLTDFTTLLTVEDQLLAARDGLALARGDRALAAVRLFNALGGDFAAAPTDGTGDFAAAPTDGTGDFAASPTDGLGPDTTPATETPTP